MGIVDHIKDAAKVARQIDNIELYRQILDLQGEALEMQEQLNAKIKRIQELEEALDKKSRLLFADNAYFETGPNGNPAGIPYCPRCYDIDNKTCHLKDWTDDTMVCPHCQTYFTTQAKPPLDV
jgi:hypothetical protein